MCMLTAAKDVLRYSSRLFNELVLYVKKKNLKISLCDLEQQ